MADEKARSWWRRALGALGVYGTLAGLGLLPLPAAVVALIVGGLAGQLAVGLGAALLLSLGVNAFLVYWMWPYGLRRRWRSHRSSVPRPKAYEREGDLDSLVLTSADFESWWANMLAVARERVASDARAYVESIHIDSSFIVFRGESVLAMKGFSGTVAGPHPSHVSWYGIHRKNDAWKSEPEAPLWRTDDSWRELVTKAWLRERPTRSGAVLYPRSGSDGPYWELVFGPYQTDDERLIRGRAYRLRHGAVVRRDQ